jgi:hypothetical protein
VRKNSLPKETETPTENERRALIVKPVERVEETPVNAKTRRHPWKKYESFARTGGCGPREFGASKP